jgi:hypothetical protein
MLAHLTLRSYPVLHLPMLPTALALANALLLPKPIIDEQVTTVSADTIHMF